MGQSDGPHAAIGEDQHLQALQRFEVLHALVADLRSQQHQFPQPPQPGEMPQPGPLDLGEGQTQVLQLVEVTEIRQGVVANGRAAEIQMPQLLELFEIEEPGVGNLRAGQIQPAQLRQILQQPEHHIGHAVGGAEIDEDRRTPAIVLLASHLATQRLDPGCNFILVDQHAGPFLMPHPASAGPAQRKYMQAGCRRPFFPR